jgi:hypothetical protein
LLIRGAEADDFAGTDEQALKVGCNMAQAFEIPKGVTGAHSGAFAAGSDVSHRKASSNAFFQIAAPGPIHGPDRYLEYGSAA